MKDYVLIVEKRILQLFVDNDTATAGSILMPNQVLHAINELLINCDDVKAKDEVIVTDQLNLFAYTVIHSEHGIQIYIQIKVTRRLMLFF